MLLDSECIESCSEERTASVKISERKKITLRYVEERI